MQNTTTTSLAHNAVATGRSFRAPQAFAEAIAFGIEAEEASILLDAMRAHRVSIDCFASTHVPRSETHERMSEQGTPPLRVVSVTFTGSPEAPDLLLALPLKDFTHDQGVELALRLIASGRSYPDHSAVSVMLGDGRELTLYGGWDRSDVDTDKPTYILGWNTDLPMGRPINHTIH